MLNFVLLYLQTDNRTVVGEAIEGLLNLGSQHIGLWNLATPHYTSLYILLLPLYDFSKYYNWSKPYIFENNTV